MTLPDIHININGPAIAFYGAVLSTLTASAQIVAFFRDRKKVTLTVSKNMRMFGDARWSDKTLITVTVTNTGRRPVTITSIGAHRLYPRTSFIPTTVNPQLPVELTEGKYCTAILEQNDEVDLPHIECWAAWDSTGKMHKLNVASWYERRKSHRARIAESKQEMKAKAAKT